MRKLRWGIIVIALFSLFGCTATGPLFSTVSQNIPTVSADKGRIYFYRPDTMLGAAVTSDITLNGGWWEYPSAAASSTWTRRPVSAWSRPPPRWRRS